MASQFRYSRPKFQVTLVVAAALTAMVAWLAWMMLTAFGSQHPRIWTGLAALVFFGFVSAGMLVRFLRDEVVLAALPTGLLDLRQSPEPFPWEAVREVVLRQTESEFELDVHLWKPQAQAAATPDFTIELASLDAPAGEIVAAIARHVRVRTAEGVPAALVN